MKLLEALNKISKIPLWNEETDKGYFVKLEFYKGLWELEISYKNDEELLFKMEDKSLCKILSKYFMKNVVAGELDENIFNRYFDVSISYYGDNQEYNEATIYFSEDYYCEDFELKTMEDLINQLDIELEEERRKEYEEAIKECRASLWDESHRYEQEIMDLGSWVKGGYSLQRENFINNF